MGSKGLFDLADTAAQQSFQTTRNRWVDSVLGFSLWTGIRKETGQNSGEERLVGRGIQSAIRTAFVGR